MFKSGPAITSQTRTYSQSGDEITLDMKTVSTDGKATNSHTTYHLDGKSYPVSGNPDYDNLAGKRLNSHQAQFTLKRGDQVIGHTTRTVSKDGKKLTTTIHETLANGDKSDNVLVFEVAVFRRPKLNSLKNVPGGRNRIPSVGSWPTTSVHRTGAADPELPVGPAGDEHSGQAKADVDRRS